MAARARAIGGAQGAGTAQSKAPKRRPMPASETSDAAPSPALMLQRALSSELEYAEPELKKWHPAATVGFVVGTCGAFWGLVALGLSAVLK